MTKIATEATLKYLVQRLAVLFGINGSQISEANSKITALQNRATALETADTGIKKDIADMKAADTSMATDISNLKVADTNIKADIKALQDKDKVLEQSITNCFYLDKDGYLCIKN